MGVVGFLQERETGSLCSSRYRHCNKSVKDWLERLSASPALNQPCEFSGEPKATFLVDFSPDRTKIASAHGDHTVRVTNVATGKCTHILTGHPRTPWCLAFHPSHDEILASGCLGGQVRIWDLRGGGSEVFHSDSNSLIASLTFHPVDCVLVFSTKNMLYFWDWTRHEPFKCCTTSFEYERVRWVKFDSLGHYLYTGICNNTTVTRAPIHEVMHRDDRYNTSGSHPNWQQRLANRQRYERLISHFFEDQQQRIRDIVGIERPTSPVHEDRLRQAFDYARYVTSHARDNYNWIQLARRRSRRGASGGVEDSSLSRPTASYSMFSQTAQPGANSPPPRPHRESDSELEDNESLPQNSTNSQQDDGRERRISSTVGSGRSSSSYIGRLNRLLNLGVRQRSSPPHSLHAISSSGRRNGDSNSVDSTELLSGSRQCQFPVNVAFSSSKQADARSGVETSQTSVSLPQNPSLSGLANCVSAQRMKLYEDTRSNVSDSTQTTLGASSMLQQSSSAMTQPGGSSEDSSMWSVNSSRTLDNSNVSVNSSRTLENSNVSVNSSRTLENSNVATGACSLQHGTLYRMLSGHTTCRNSAFSSPSALSSAQSGTFQVAPSLVSESTVTHSQNTRQCVSSDSLPSTSNRDASAAGHCTGTDSDRDSSLDSVPLASTAKTDVTSSLTSSVAELSSTGASSAPVPIVSSSSFKRSYYTAFGHPLPNSSSVTASSNSEQTQTSSINSQGSASVSLSERLWRSRLRSLNQRAPTSAGLGSENVSVETGDYIPGSQSCSYLHSQLALVPESSSLRAAIVTDITRVRRLAHISLGWSCDFDCQELGSARCPVCRYSPLQRLSSMQIPRRDERSELSSRVIEIHPFGIFGRQRLGGRSCTIPDYNSERTSDGTSQTQGQLNEPEHSDRGTDMIGLAQLDIGSMQEEQLYMGSDGRVTSREGVQGRTATTSQVLQCVTSDLERQLSENDDEISRIETSYLEEMERLAGERRRILSTIRDCNDSLDSGLSSRQNSASTESHIAAVSSQSNSSSSITGSVSGQNGAAIVIQGSSHPTSSNCMETDQNSPSNRPSQHSASRPGQTLDDLGPLHTLPATSGTDQDSIEVLTGSGESEIITFSELARRLANRDDVMVVGNHRLASASSPAASSTTTSTAEQGRSHLLRTCLVNSGSSVSQPAPVPPSQSFVPTVSLQSERAAGTPVPPVILVQRPLSEGPPQRSNQEDRNHNQGTGDAEWYGLEQRHLHPHYSRSILDETINRPNDAMQFAINRAIAGVFMSSGEQAVASNIVPGTHRIQRWDFRQCQMPDLTQSKSNIVVEHCKIHNDASIDLSRDSSLLATFVNNHGGFPDDNILAVFSLHKDSFGQCLYTKSFGPNAISVSLSPSNQYVMVGLASKRMLLFHVTDQLVGQIFRLNKAGAGEHSMMHVTDLYHPVRRQTTMVRGMSPVSVNSARWLPDVGEGIVYGTNHGDLHFFRAGRTKAGVEEEEAKPRRFTISTQTGTGSIRRSAFTQTADDEHAS